MPSYVCFDTETTGIAPEVRPTIVQLFYKYVSDSGKELAVFDGILRFAPDAHADGRARITDGSQKVHGISEEIRERDGLEPAEVLSEFMHVLMENDANGGIIVGHNIAFDINALNNTLEILCPAAEAGGLVVQLPCVCTMAAGRDICCVEVRTDAGVLCVDRLFEPSGKSPKLIELCHHFGIVPDEAKLHDASYDVEMTIACFEKLAAISKSAVNLHLHIHLLSDFGWQGVYSEANALFAASDEALHAEAAKLYQCDTEQRTKLRRCEQGTDVWYKARRPITASRIGAVMGLDTFCSPYGAVVDKIESSKISRCAMNFGNFFEDFVQDAYVRWARRQYAEVTVSNMGTEVVEERPYCSFSPDGLVELRREPGGPLELGLMEYKCPGRGKFLSADGEQQKISLLEKPTYYAQIQLEMHFLRRRFTHFVFLNFDTADHRRVVPRDLMPLTDFAATSDRFSIDDEDVAFLYDNALAAVESDPGTYVLPYNSDIGGLAPINPVVFLFSRTNECIGAVLASEALTLEALNPSTLCFELAAGSALPARIRDAIAARVREIPEDAHVKPFLGPQRSKPYLERFLVANGAPYEGRILKAQLLERCNAVAANAARPVYPDVRNRLCISVVEYAYDEHFVELMLRCMEPGGWFTQFLRAKAVAERSTWH